MAQALLTVAALHGDSGRPQDGMCAVKEEAVRTNRGLRSRSLARPSAASLNSLAEVLRQAQPLYTECRSILNYLDHSDVTVSVPLAEDFATGSDCLTASKDAASISQSIFEHKNKYEKGIV